MKEKTHKWERSQQRQRKGYSWLFFPFQYMLKYTEQWLAGWNLYSTFLICDITLKYKSFFFATFNMCDMTLKDKLFFLPAVNVSHRMQTQSWRPIPFSPESLWTKKAKFPHSQALLLALDFSAANDQLIILKMYGLRKNVRKTKLVDSAAACSCYAYPGFCSSARWEWACTEDTHESWIEYILVNAVLFGLSGNVQAGSALGFCGVDSECCTFGYETSNNDSLSKRI